MKNTCRKLMAATLSMLLVGLLLSSGQSGASSNGQNSGSINQPAYGVLNDLPDKGAFHD